jgi:hypothetical protein
MLAFLLLTLSAPVMADDDADRAKELYTNGMVLVKEGRYDEAILAWETAYGMVEKPMLLYNIYLAYESKGELENAKQMLLKYRVFAHADEQEDLRKRLEVLETKLAAVAEVKAEAAAKEEAAAKLAAAEAVAKAAAAPPPVAPQPQEVMQPALPEKSSKAGLVALSVSGASLASAIAGTMMANQALAQRNEACVAFDGNFICDQSGTHGLGGEYGRYKLLAQLSWGAFGATALTGTYLQLSSDGGSLALHWTY